MMGAIAQPVLFGFDGATREWPVTITSIPQQGVIRPVVPAQHVQCRARNAVCRLIRPLRRSPAPARVDHKVGVHLSKACRSTGGGFRRQPQMGRRNQTAAIVLPTPLLTSCCYRLG